MHCTTYNACHPGSDWTLCPPLSLSPFAAALLSEQRALCVVVVAERQALRAAGGDLQRLLRNMNEQPGATASTTGQVYHTPASSKHATLLHHCGHGMVFPESLQMLTFRGALLQILVSCSLSLSGVHLAARPERMGPCGMAA